MNGNRGQGSGVRGQQNRRMVGNAHPTAIQNPISKIQNPPPSPPPPLSPSRRLCLGSNGFTLLEVLVAMALALLLMAALMQSMDAQSRYSQVAEEKMSEPQIARVLLHRIAEELRGVRAPVDGWQDPGRARRLLSFADVKWDERESESAAALDPSTEETMSMFVEDQNALGGAERFGLLGTSNRLLLLTHRPSEPESALEWSQDAESQPIVDSATGDKRREPTRWGDIRQVFYLPRPLPEALSDRSEGASSGEEAISEANSEEVVIDPYFGGVLRQEVALPFELDASRLAFEQLVKHLMAEEEATSLDPEFTTAPFEDETSNDEAPLPPRVVTDVLTEQVTAIRFRYHDGHAWHDSWFHHAALPRAVEISLSFDPRASDPLWLAEYFEEERKVIEAGGTARKTGATTSEDESEAPVFPYRLVVALPAADRTPVATEEGHEGELERTPGLEEALP